MSKHHYGHALYYPYIHFQDEDWLKTAALYYNGLTRIVPENFKTQDSAVVRRLDEQCDFIRNYHPSEEPYDIAENFLDFSRKNLINKQNRDNISRKLSQKIPPEQRFPIHDNKFADMLLDELTSLGLTSLQKRKTRWRYFDALTGAMYMSSLANKIAEKQRNPIVTDTPYFQPMIRYFQETETEFEETVDIGHAIASLVIKTVIPKDIKTVGISQIVEFRDDYKKERVRFFEAIENIVADIPSIEDPVAFEDCLEHHKIKIIDSVDGLRMSLANVGIGCVTSLLGLSVPSWATTLAEILPGIGPQIVIVGLVGMGVCVVLREGNNYYQSDAHCMRARPPPFLGMSVIVFYGSIG